MNSINREFYDIEEAANELEISVTDIWHLIELGEINASIRQAIVDASFGAEEVASLVACHTFLIPKNVAGLLAAKGSTKMTYAYLQLIEPREVAIPDLDGVGKDGILLSDTHFFNLDQDITVQKSDVVITQLSIDKYMIRTYGNFNGSNQKVLSTRTENNYLRLILTLANNIEGFNPKKPYEAAQLIIDATEIDISQQTISDYIKKAYQIESQKRD